jgi:hypothetical protein
MKLLYCKKCKDVINLKLELKTCSCEETEGRYIDDINAEYSGKHAIPFAIDNFSFAARARGKKASPISNNFYDNLHGKDKIQCWIMNPENPNYETIKKVEKKKERTCGPIRKAYKKKAKK